MAALYPRNPNQVFSLDFQRMCEVVAIAETGNKDEIARQLILHTLVILPEDKFDNIQLLTDTLNTLFGLRLSEQDVQPNVDALIDRGDIQRVQLGRLVASKGGQAKVKARIDEAMGIEDMVKNDWLDEVNQSYPALPLDETWKILNRYLARAFRRHGIQSVALLDPTFDIANEDTESLSRLLTEAIGNNLPVEQHAHARSAIASFFVAAASRPERSRYISQLADGAFNYFSLVVAPDVSAMFRRRLSALNLFLDTNFLFGILGLHVNPQVEISHRLLEAITKHSMPFALQYHVATAKEFLSSISYYGDQLRSRAWTQGLSRAATRSRFVSGIERNYHKQFLATGIDVDSFLRPYLHPDELLKARGIAKYAPTDARLAQRADLINDYKEYLKSMELEKPYNIIDHDATLLDTVDQLQSNTLSSIESGALLVTCDFRLYSFDLVQSRRGRHAMRAVLPNILWQILRPFIPTDVDFDHSFAQTFAIPEFRTISSDSAVAASKLLHILAGYKDLPEETAARMLSNDILIEGIRKSRDDRQIEAFVESAMAAENAVLLEEKAALEIQLQTEREEVASQKMLVAQKAAELESKREEADAVRQAFDEKLKTNETSYERLASEVEVEKRTRIEAEQKLAEESRYRQSAERRAMVYGFVAAVVLSGIISFIGVWLLNFQFPWQWLINNTNSYGIQATAALIILFILLGVFIPQWRKRVWSGGGIGALVLVLFTILGGPSN